MSGAETPQMGVSVKPSNMTFFLIHIEMQEPNDLIHFAKTLHPIQEIFCCQQSRIFLAFQTLGG